MTNDVYTTIAKHLLRYRSYNQKGTVVKSTAWEIACEIMNNIPSIKVFVQEMFKKAIAVAKESTLTNEELKTHLEPAYNKGDVNKVKKAGLPDEEIEKVMSVQGYVPENIHQMLGGLYLMKLDGKFIRHCIGNNEGLRVWLMGEFNRLFHCNLSWDLVEEWDDIPRIMLNILLYASGDATLFEARMVNDLRGKGDKVFVNASECHSSLVSDSQQIEHGGPWVVKESSVFTQVMQHYRKPYLSGPSGSVINLHVFVFKFLGIEETEHNKKLLLLTAVAHYVPYFHTLEEILLSYSHKVASPPRKSYTLEEDAILYIRSVMDEL